MGNDLTHYGRFEILSINALKSNTVKECALEIKRLIEQTESEDKE